MSQQPNSVDPEKLDELISCLSLLTGIVRDVSLGAFPNLLDEIDRRIAKMRKGEPSNEPAK